MSSVTLATLTKSFNSHRRALDRLSLEIGDGEFMVLVGPSGCGKSTILRLIAGLEEVTDGAVFIGDRNVTSVPPQARNVAMVFQNYALYPHMTVRKNLGFGLKVRKVNSSEISRRVSQVAHTLGLEDLLERKPAQLSGGQQQRVAIGRALVREPEVLLMDEPLSNLDAKLRVAMRAELIRLHKHVGMTTVYVTHDQVEAMTLGDRLAVLRDGVLQQCDTPQVVFRQPANLFVAAFIGSPSINLAEATVMDGVARFADVEVPLSACPSARSRPRIILGVRPGNLVPAAAAPAGLPRVSARVDLVEDLGAARQVYFTLEVPRVNPEKLLDGVDGITLLAPSDRAVWTAVLDHCEGVSAGQTIELALLADHIHAFDPATGERLQ